MKVPAATGADDEVEIEVIPAANVGPGVSNDFSRSVRDVSGDGGTSPIQVFFSTILIISVIASMVVLNNPDPVVQPVKSKLYIVNTCLTATPIAPSQSDVYMFGYPPVYTPATPTSAVTLLHN